MEIVGDRTSEESRSTFFRRGEMYAALKTAGTQPVESERLNSSVKKSARTSMMDLSVGVGSGSRVQSMSPLQSHSFSASFFY